MNSTSKYMRSKAVRDAWKNEKELVANGKGTRDWTPQQQISILTRGKAYDDNGKAYHGHHMFNVKDHPEKQGDWRNIQFLSREEHTLAHNKNFRNMTSGKYDYKTGKTDSFTNKELSQPEAFRLSNRVPASKVEAARKKMSQEKLQNKSKASEKFNAEKSKSATTSRAATMFNAPSAKQSGQGKTSAASVAFGASHGASQGASHGAAKGGKGHGH